MTPGARGARPRLMDYSSRPGRPPPPARSLRVKLESNFASIVFAIMVLEGLGRSLDPKLDILEAAKPFLLKGPVSPP